MPSPSMKGINGSSGTFSEESGLTVIRCPEGGRTMCSYCMADTIPSWLIDEWPWSWRPYLRSRNSAARWYRRRSPAARSGLGDRHVRNPEALRVGDRDAGVIGLVDDPPDRLEVRHIEKGAQARAVLAARVVRLAVDPAVALVPVAIELR